MKQLLDLLKYPHAVEAKLTISDEMITGFLVGFVNNKLVQDIRCKIKEGVMEVQLTVGYMILAKRFLIELEIEDLIFDDSSFVLTLKARGKSLSLISTVMNLLGKSSVSIIRFDKEYLHIDLTRHRKEFLAKQPIAIRNELKQIRISKPVLIRRNILVTITKA